MDESKQLDVIAINLPKTFKLGPTARKVLALRFEHPEFTHQQLGQQLGISYQRVGQILNHDSVLKLLPAISKQRIRGMIPKATKQYEKLITHDNAIISERASAKILTENKVFDAPESKTTVDITIRSVSELQEIVNKASQLPKNVIDAEVVDEPTSE